MKIRPRNLKKKRKLKLVDSSPNVEQQKSLVAVAKNRIVRYLSADDYDDDDDGSGGDDGGEIGRLKPIDFKTDLLDSTEAMEIERRLLEQEGEKQFAKVNARERHESSNSNGVGQVLKQHPNKMFESQLYAGDFSPTDFSPGEAENYMRERAEQEKEKQLRLQKSLQNRNEYRNNYIPTPGA